MSTAPEPLLAGRRRKQSSWNAFQKAHKGVPGIAGLWARHKLGEYQCAGPDTPTASDGNADTRTSTADQGEGVQTPARQCPSPQQASSCN